ncbi:MAG TPA: hypothetical protein VGM91_01015 [Conexibacter sp.]|jgi:O-antigen/teichoic acid export membrane protein
MPRRGTTLVLRSPGTLLGVAGAAIRRVPGGRAGDPLLRSANALIVSTIAASGFGIAYWIVAARTYPEHVLGVQSAAISTMLMLSNFAQMNMFFSLGRFVPTAGRETGRLITSVYAASVALSAALGIGFVVLAPLVSESLATLFTGPVMAVAFVVGVALWSVFALQDGVLTALRRASWVPVENALFGLVKLVLLFAFAAVFVSGGIFASWTIPMLLAIVPVNLLIYRRVLRARASSDAPAGAFSFASIRRFVAVDYVGGLFLQSYTTALPLVIVATLGARANAEFYVAYVVIAAVDLVSVNLATSLLVEGAHDEARLAEYTRRIVRRSAQLLVPAVIVIELGAPYFTQALGHEYANASTALLRLLALGSLARMLNIVYMSVMRVHRRVWRVVATQAALSVIVLSLTLALSPGMGVNGVGVAWLTAQLAVAVALAPWLWRTMRSEPR